MSSKLKRSQIFAGIILFLIITEAVIRIFPPTVLLGEMYLDPVIQTDELLGFRLKPNVNRVIDGEIGRYRIKTNTYGHRSDNFPLDEKRYKILVLGNSFVFGAGVEQEYIITTHLQKLMDKSAPGQIRVINAAVPEYALNRSFVSYAARAAKQFKPNLVVAFFSTSDLNLLNAPEHKDRIVWNGINLPPPRQVINYKGKWQTYLFIRHLILSENSRKPKINMTLRVDELPIEAGNFHKDYPHNIDIMTKNLSVILSGFKDITTKNKAKFVFVYLPHTRESEEHSRQKTMALYGITDGWDWERPRKKVLNTVTALQLNHIDLTPAFTLNWNKTKRSLYLNNGGGHLTEDGNKLAAHIIFPQLVKIIEE